MEVVDIKKILVPNLLIYIYLHCVRSSSWCATMLATLMYIHVQQNIYWNIIVESILLQFFFNKFLSNTFFFNFWTLTQTQSALTVQSSAVSGAKIFYQFPLTNSKLRTIALLRYYKREEFNASSSLKIPPI